MTTLANKLTLGRIFLIPVFVYFLMSDNNTASAILFASIMLTDFLDGYIARKYDQVTKLGQFLDPLADKLVITAALIFLVEKNMTSGWMAFIIIAREIAVTGLRLVISVENKTVVSASILGKIKTISQTIAVLVSILDYRYSVYVMGIAVFFTILSGMQYFWQYRAVLGGSR